MRSVIPLILLVLIVSCRSNKEIAIESTQQTDSIASTRYHRTIISIDSVVRNIDFRFDTLNVNIERPVEYAETPEVLRLTAIKGEVVDKRQLQRQQLRDYNRCDTVAFKQVSADSSAEHSSVTRIYDPPNVTPYFLTLLIAVAAILFFIYYHKHNM